MQVSGPLLRGLRLAARDRFEAPDRPSPPGREMRDNVLYRPRTGDAGLFHAVLADLREKTLPRLVLGIELGKQISSTHRRPPLISLRLTSSSSASSPGPCASASSPQGPHPSERLRSRQQVQPDRSRRSRLPEPPLVPRDPAWSDPPATASARSPIRRFPVFRLALRVAVCASARAAHRVAVACAPRPTITCRHRPRSARPPFIPST